MSQDHEKRCEKARRTRAIDAAFRAGDLDALRAAVEDPDAIPNGLMPRAVGNCLVYAISHAPLAFIREVLDIGADPNAPTDDGFPPLIAAIGTSRDAPGSPARPDVDDIVRLLLERGADPNQRGLNDFTALHMAVAERNHLAVQRLLDAGADPDLRTRIDDRESPLELAQALGLADIAATLERRGRPIERRLRSGVVLLWDVPGAGEEVRRQHTYQVTTRMWLADGHEVRWPESMASKTTRIGDDGRTVTQPVWINRGSLISGVFYGTAGMRVGGTRRLRIAPHMAYGTSGLEDAVPPDASLEVELTILAGQTAEPKQSSTTQVSHNS